MTPDLLDDLLDRSVPATRAVADLEFEAMIAEARREVPRPRRTRRIAITAGALAAVLVGGAGVAAATDGFSWAPWAQDPVGAVSFTMSNGLECELRFSRYSGAEHAVFLGDGSKYSGAEHAAFLGDVNRTLEDWYRSTDVVGEAEALLPQQREDLAAMSAASEEDPEADMSLLSPAEQAKEIEHRAFSREWLAWDLVVSDLEAQALRAAGFSVPDDRFIGSERAGQIQCIDENGDLYMPGAGS